MQERKLGIVGLLACGVLLCAVSAEAAPIQGSYSGSGFATVSFTNLNFCPTAQEPDGPNQGDACSFGVGNVSLGGGAGDFATVTGVLNTVDSLNSGIAPIGVNVNIPLWMEFTPVQGAPPISLTLTQVLAGSFSSAACGDAPAAGQVCTPGGSGFNLVNQTSGSSTASFQIIGDAVNGVPGDTSPFVAIFTSQFTVPFQTLLAALAENQGTGNYSSTYSLSVDVNAIPEPMSMSLIGAGLIGLVMLQRRRARR